MARIIKLIWRLDFKASYPYIDKRGTALDVLTNTVENFWTVVGDGAQHMSFVGRTADDKAYRNCSIEPTNMNGTFEFVPAIELDKVLQTQDFRNADKIVKELLKVYETKIVTRAGLRLICLASFADGGGEALRRVTNGLGKNTTEFVASALGEITDVAQTIEGEAADKVKYRLAFGPYHRKNPGNYLEQKINDSKLSMLGENDLILDIDLYETQISFAELSLYRWASTKVSKAVNLVTSATKAYPKGS